MTPAPQAIRSVGLFCGSSDGADPTWLREAATLGRRLAEADVRLVYGGGAIGLMGACAREVLAHGGRVLGVIPEFLRLPEVAFEAAELVVVGSMHERKALMFREADAFAVLPGGVGTLEEAIELLSWARLNLHTKPIVFVNANGFWSPLLDLFDHTIREGFAPPEFRRAYAVVDSAADVLGRIEAMAGEARGAADPRFAICLT